MLINHSRNRALSCALLSLLAIVGLRAVSVRSQEQDRTAELPLIVGVEPAAAAPLTKIHVDGYRLGANLEKGGRVLFAQGVNEYEVAFSGGGYQPANLKQGPQSVKVIVPGALQPGPCQLTVEVEGNRSRPFNFQINVPATAPVLTQITPHIPRPTEMIWIDGSGFSDSDEVQLIDARGRKHRFDNQLGTSNANTIAFALPENVPGGEASLRVIEHRSGADLESNILTFKIVRGLTPLEIYPEWLMPVAPGQWLDFVVNSCDPLKDADHVDVSFRQNDQSLIMTTRSVCDLRMQVPASLSGGSVILQTRTLAKGEASEWSRPISYQLLEKPAAAKVYSLEIRAVRAEAAFRQNGKIVAIAAVSEADYPRVRVPNDKLSPGDVEVLTRVWRGGTASEWSFQHYGVNWPNTTFLSDGTMGDVPFINGITLGPETPKTLTVYPGERLVLGGTFPFESAADARVTLTSQDRLPIVLRSREGGSPRRVKIELPDTLEEGEWELTVEGRTDGSSMKLPVRLRALPGAGKRGQRDPAQR